MVQLADRDPAIPTSAVATPSRPGQIPIAYDERHRFFTGKLRRAIQVRDRHCTARGCDRPAEYCDVDHIDPVAAGGRTRPDNGRVACSPDNRARPRRRFHGDPDP